MNRALQSNAEQNVEELKRRRNRLAQRKHRQRKKASAENPSETQRKSSSRSIAGGNNTGQEGADTPHNGGGPSERYPAGVFHEDQEPNQRFLDAGVFNKSSNHAETPTVMDELNLSLLVGTNEAFSTDRDVCQSELFSSHFQLNSSDSAMGASPFFGTDDSCPSWYHQIQAVPTSMSPKCACHALSLLYPDAHKSSVLETATLNQMAPSKQLEEDRRKSFVPQISKTESYAGKSLKFIHFQGPQHLSEEFESQNYEVASAGSNSTTHSEQERPQTQNHYSTNIASAPQRITSTKNDGTGSAPHDPSRLHSASSSTDGSNCVPISPPSGVRLVSTSNPKSTAYLEKRFEHIMDIVEEAGFDSIDSMVSCYYTTKFPVNSICASAQALSRRRYLRKFLEDLRNDATTWDVTEAHGYVEGIMGSALSVCSEELARFRSYMSEDGENFEGLQKVREAFLGADISGSLKGEKRFLKERVSIEF